MALMVVKTLKIGYTVAKGRYFALPHCKTVEQTTTVDSFHFNFIFMHYLTKKLSAIKLN